MNWNQNGATDTYDQCNQKAKELLEAHQVAPKSDRILDEIGDILEIRSLAS